MPRRPSPRARRRWPSRDDASLRPAETRCPVPWCRREVPPQAAAAGWRLRRTAVRGVQKSEKNAPNPPLNCRSRTKVRKKCTAPPQAGQTHTCDPRPPQAGPAGRAPRPRHLLAARRSSRALPVPACRVRAWLPALGDLPPRTELGLASRTPACGPRDVLKIDQNVFSGRKMTAFVLKIGQSVFPGRGFQGLGVPVRVAGFFVPSEKPQVRMGLPFSWRAGLRDAGPSDAAVASRSRRPEIHSGRFSAHRLLSGCRKIHSARFSAHSSRAMRA